MAVDDETNNGEVFLIVDRPEEIFRYEIKVVD
jgi:hypothetical protein